MAVRLLHASLAIPEPWDGLDRFTRAIGAWQQSAPEFLPTVADDHEPVRTPFDVQNLAASLSAWNSRLWIGRRTKPTVLSSFQGSWGFTNSTAHFTIPRPDDAARVLASLESLVFAISSEFNPDLAIIHALCEGEVQEGLGQRRPDIHVINRIKLTVDMSTGFSKQLEHGLPTLYWTNIFGPRYEETLGERLFSAPWAAIERRSCGVVARVTVNPPDDESWPTFKAARDRLVDFIGRDAFWPDATRVPDLSLLPARG